MTGEPPAASWPPRWLLLTFAVGFVAELAALAWINTWVGYVAGCVLWPVLCLVGLIAAAPRRNPDADHIRTLRGDR